MRASRQFLNMMSACTCRRFRQILTTNDSRTGSAAPRLLMRAALDLDGDVAQALQVVQPLLVDRGLQRRIRDQRNDGSAMTGPQLPDMQIGDAVLALLQPCTNVALQLPVESHVEQNAAGVANQRPGPACDHDAANEADRRVGPVPAREHRDDECSDGQHRRCRIRQHMHIGRAKIVVAVVVAVIVVVIMMVVMMTMNVRVTVMMMIVTVAQQPRADKIYGEAEASHRNRLTVDDRHRGDQPQYALISDLDRDHAEDERAGERGKITELACPERKTRISRLPAREQIGRTGNAERRGMRAHVPAVGKQRHRAEEGAGDDLAGHHDKRQRDHEPGAALVPRVLLAEEDVIMRVPIEGMGVHRATSGTSWISLRYNDFGSEYYHTTRGRRSFGRPRLTEGSRFG